MSATTTGDAEAPMVNVAPPTDVNEKFVRFERRWKESVDNGSRVVSLVRGFGDSFVRSKKREELGEPSKTIVALDYAR